MASNVRRISTLDVGTMYKEMTKGFVYFIQEVNSKCVKIGFTMKSPTLRLSTLQVGNPNKLVLLGWLWGNEDVEAYIQAMFRKTQVSGEWFEGNEELLQFIQEKNCASN